MPIKMFANATGDNAASIDIPQDGGIVGFSSSFTAADLDAAGDVARWELSFHTTNQLGNNDARGTIGQGEMLANIEGTPASAVAQTMENYINLQPDGIPVNVGERLHIHMVLSSGVSANLAIVVFLKIGRGRAPRRSARRR